MWPKPWQDPDLVRQVGEKKAKKAKTRRVGKGLGKAGKGLGKGKGKTIGKALGKAGKGLGKAKGKTTGKGLGKGGKGLGKVKGKFVQNAEEKAKMKSKVWAQLDVNCISADYRNTLCLHTNIRFQISNVFKLSRS